MSRVGFSKGAGGRPIGNGGGCGCVGSRQAASRVESGLVPVGHCRLGALKGPLLSLFPVLRPCSRRRDRLGQLAGFRSTRECAWGVEACAGRGQSALAESFGGPKCELAWKRPCACTERRRLTGTPATLQIWETWLPRGVRLVVVAYGSADGHGARKVDPLIALGVEASEEGPFGGVWVPFGGDKVEKPAKPGQVGFVDYLYRGVMVRARSARGARAQVRKSTSRVPQWVCI